MSKREGRILFVDDDTNVLDALRRQYSTEFDVALASSPAEALEQIEREEFRVVVSDLRMPETDGLRLISLARQKRPGLVTVLLSGEADMNDALTALNSGQIFRFLTKPCPRETMVATLNSALEQFEKQQAERGQSNIEDVYAALRRAQDEAAAAQKSLAELVQRNQKSNPPAAPPPSDPEPAESPKNDGGANNGMLPDRRAAELQLNCAFLKPDLPYVAAFFIHRYQFACTRYGTAVGNQILLACTQFLASNLRSAAMFSWKNQAVIAIIDPFESPAAVRAYLQTLVASSRTEYFQTSSRSVFLQIKIAFELFPLAGTDYDRLVKSLEDYFKQEGR